MCHDREMDLLQTCRCLTGAAEGTVSGNVYSSFAVKRVKQIVDGKKQHTTKLDGSVTSDDVSANSSPD